jgi:hypothetical protein
MSKERLTAEEFLDKKYNGWGYEAVIHDWVHGIHSNVHLPKLLTEFAAQEVEAAIAETKNKAIGVDAFCDRLDNIFEMGNPTKAQIIDAYNKSVAERMPTEKDAIRYAADYATELDASEEPHTDIEKMDTFLHGTRWFRSRIENLK